MTQPSVAGTRVLVVEDEAVVVMMLEAMLDELGCTVAGVASEPQEAEALLEPRAFDCALLDINLGGKPVYPLAEKLAKHGIPFIFVTGYDRPDVQEDLRNWPVLRKPFDLASLQQALASALQLSTR